jgi:hypothetical protein
MSTRRSIASSLRVALRFFLQGIGFIGRMYIMMYNEIRYFVPGIGHARSHLH